MVLSTAIGADNVELVRARELGLRTVHRGQVLAALTRGVTTVAVSGTHGKTTTTSMTVVALQGCGWDPTFAIGGQLVQAGTNGHLGLGAPPAGDEGQLAELSRLPVAVVEADESDASFLLLTPQVAVVTNIEADHLDYWGDLATLESGFDAFADRLTAEPSEPGEAAETSDAHRPTVDADASTGCQPVLVCCLDDPGAAALAERASGRGICVHGYSLARSAALGAPTARTLLDQVELTASGSSARVRHGGAELGRLHLSVPGEHNLRNAAAALTAGLALGAPAAGLLAGLAGFAGAGRRFDRRGQARGVSVVDDYAHHPTEVRATLAAARQLAGDHRVIVVFQPHRFTRTADVGSALGQALGGADEVIVMGVYSAGEDPIPGVDEMRVIDAVPLAPEHVHHAPDRSTIPALLAHLVAAGDVVLTMGAGDVTLLGPLVFAELTATELTATELTATELTATEDLR